MLANRKGVWMDTETEVRKRLFTVREYHRMVEAGILLEGDRIELIDGEIIEMIAMDRRHWVCVARASTFFIRTFGEGAVVATQLPLKLSEWTEPLPDVVLYKPRPDFYAKKTIGPDDVLFLLEVSLSSLSFDLKIKVPRYAAAGIPEVWIADLQHDTLRVLRSPSAGAYEHVLTFGPGETVSPLAFPETSFRVEELLTTDFEDSPDSTDER